ncbi:hypothetical protein PsYK624_166740 [Phanerochaete sordida]|uniref:Uncharacterized protein n=1 Tax=Phanerochaete sordida TaxID=48140 RepID=A0A9P3GSH5_9APHY|nr:hypothetical protein PsYK624_166740 [Phanerochaete sordida]
MPSKAARAAKAKQTARSRARTVAADTKANKQRPEHDENTPVTIRLPARRETCHEAAPATPASANDDASDSVESPAHSPLQASNSAPDHSAASGGDDWVAVDGILQEAQEEEESVIAISSRESSASPPFTPRTLALMDLVSDEALNSGTPCPPRTRGRTGATRADTPMPAAPGMHGTQRAPRRVSHRSSSSPPSPKTAPDAHHHDNQPQLKRSAADRSPQVVTPERLNAHTRKKARTERAASVAASTASSEHASDTCTSPEGSPPSSRDGSPTPTQRRRASAPPREKSGDTQGPLVPGCDAPDASAPLAVRDGSAPPSRFAPGTLAAVLQSGQRHSSASLLVVSPGASTAAAAMIPSIVGNGPHWLLENQDLAQVDEWCSYPGGKVLMAMYSRGALDYAVDPSAFHLYSVASQAIARFLNVERVLRSPPIAQQTPTVLNAPPYGSLIHGITVEQAVALLRQRCIHNGDFAVLFFPFGLQRCGIFLSFGQIAYRTEQEVRAMALNTMRERNFAKFVDLVTSSPTLSRRGEPVHVADELLRTVEITSSPQFSKGSVPTPVFNLELALPSIPLTEWLAWSSTLRSITWGDSSFGTVSVRDFVVCAGCHSCAHYHWACPFKDVPGWQLNIPRAAIHTPAGEGPRTNQRPRRRGDTGRT